MSCCILNNKRETINTPHLKNLTLQGNFRKSMDHQRQVTNIILTLRGSYKRGRKWTWTSLRCWWCLLYVWTLRELSLFNGQNVICVCVCTYLPFCSKISMCSIALGRWPGLIERIDLFPAPRWKHSVWIDTGLLTSQTLILNIKFKMRHGKWM